MIGDPTSDTKLMWPGKSDNAGHNSNSFVGNFISPECLSVNSLFIQSLCILLFFGNKLYQIGNSSGKALLK